MTFEDVLATWLVKQRCYQLYIGQRARLPARLRHARIGSCDGQQLYDGLHDSDLTRTLLTRG